MSLVPFVGLFAVFLGVSTALQVAVVQYTPYNDVTKTPMENMMQHVSDVAGWTGVVADSASLVVFPELSLGFNCTSRNDAASYGVILPDSPRIIPCGNASYNNQPALQVLSCAARQKSGVTLVVGGVEVVPCSSSVSSCPSDGHWLYNSAFTFASNGSVISVARKAHLFAEAGCLDTAPIRPATFPLSINATHSVNVGVVICYDIEYSSSVESVLRAGADILAVPMNWMNTVPVSSAQALQQAMSYHYNTTILAANIGLPGGSGSGVYVNGSTIASKFNYSIILDDGPVVATVPFPARLQQGTPSPTSFEAPIDRSENDRNTVHSQELVSPCGPPPYSDLQETTCALTEVFPGPTYQYHLKTSSGSLVCSAVYEGNAVGNASVAITLFVMQANLTFPGATAVLNTEFCSLYVCLDPPQCANSFPAGGSFPELATFLNTSSVKVNAGWSNADTVAVLPSWLNASFSSGSLSDGWAVTGPGTRDNSTAFTRIATTSPPSAFVSATLQGLYD